MDERMIPKILDLAQRMGAYKQGRTANWKEGVQGEEGQLPRPYRRPRSNRSTVEID
jgi:hypothetical protein